MRKYIIPIIILLLNIACNPPAVFEEYKELPREKWNKDSIVELTANIPDSSLYNISVCLRHTTDYEMANLWCFVSVHSQGTEILRDTLDIKMADTDGRWLGQGGNVKQIQQLINSTPIMLPKGEVIFRIEQGMRIDDMNGIRNVGIKVETIKSQDLGTKQDGKK